jgi:hypothetical protein
MEALERDISSCRRELITLKQAVGARTAKDFTRKAAILLAYAHIEGAIKASLSILFLRLNASGLVWGQVRPRLAHFEIDRRLTRLSTPRAAIANDDTTAYLRTLSDRTIEVDVFDLIGRVGIVNRQALERILAMCHLDATSYREDLATLDPLLVSRRNELAHGGQVPVDPIAAEGAIDTALRVIDLFLADFGNLLVLQSYKVAPATS